jgi:hypothetical protein
MLLDTLHRRWCLGTMAAAAVAIVVYWMFAARSTDGLTGASTVGLWYGVAGGGLVVLAGLLAVVRRVPVWWPTGTRRGWLRAHGWVAMLAAVVLLCHSGFRWGGPLEQMLWLTGAGVVATGVAGALVQTLLPRLLTTRVSWEVPPEQLDASCLALCRESDALVDEVCGAFIPGESLPAERSPETAAAQLRRFHEEELRRYLRPRPPRRSPLANPRDSAARFGRLRALPILASAHYHLDRLEALCDTRRQLAEQQRLLFWMHAWLVLHLPLCGALLALCFAHAIFSLYY